MSAPIAVPDFSGEPGDVIQSAEFLKKFRTLMNIRNIMENPHMISSFKNYLKYNSPADEWFRELNTEGMTWKTLEKGFLECFPPIQKAKKSESELERELCELRLKVDELGKKEKYAGEEVWLHVAFAEKALSLARQAKIDKGSNSIWKVCDELLEIIHQKVKETYTMWNEFCTAIKEVDTSHIRNGMKKHQKEKEEKERVESMIASLCQTQQQQQCCQQSPTVPLLPMSNASNAMQSMTIRNTRPAPATTTNATPQTAMANTNPFATSGGGQGNLFCQPLPPVTNMDRDALWQSLTYYPLQPNTPDGNMAWMAQLRDWREKNRDSFITETTGFPLHPGGAPPGSGECYGCGHVGHHQDSGLCTTETLNPHEHTFQTICRCILHAAPAAQVNLIEDTGDEFSWLSERTLMHMVDQGNGEGSSA